MAAAETAPPFQDQPIEGLRVVYECAEQSKIVADIVFIHGLTGGSERTWLDASSGTYWPSQLLATDTPNTRVLAFDYDADVTKWLGPVSQNNIQSHADALLIDLAALRDNTKSVRQYRVANLKC